MNDITALVSVQKSANMHRLSRLIAYAPSDELRQMAVEVEQYTDRLLGALEHYKSREERVTKLVLDNSLSWEELFKQLEEAKQRNTELVEALEKAQADSSELKPANLINKFYERYPVASFKSESVRAAALGYFMAGAELQCFGEFVKYEELCSDE